MALQIGIPRKPAEIMINMPIVIWIHATTITARIGSILLDLDDRHQKIEDSHVANLTINPCGRRVGDVRESKSSIGSQRKAVIAQCSEDDSKLPVFGQHFMIVTC